MSVESIDSGYAPPPPLPQPAPEAPPAQQSTPEPPPAPPEIQELERSVDIFV